MAIGYCPFSQVLLKYSNSSVTAGSCPLSIVVIAVKDQWKKICLFEHHFSKSLFYIQTESYENIIHQTKILGEAKELL
jgi:hypothetical protein